MLQAETLEFRRLFAVTVVVENQILKIFGDNTKNVVELGINRQGTVIDVNTDDAAEPFLVNVADIKSISASLGEGADTFIGGTIPLPMYVKGGKGPDSISGGRGNDTIIADGGFDYLYGREGNDSLDGGLQGDEIFGVEGDDIIIGISDLADNDDTISGGVGSDVLDYSAYQSPVLLQIGNLAADPEDVSDFVLPDIERIIGSARNDRITNMHRNPVRIEGGVGNDLLVGGSGNDTLVGGPGLDTLRGMGGADSLFADGDNQADEVDGGSGADFAEVDELDTLLNVP